MCTLPIASGRLTNILEINPADLLTRGVGDPTYLLKPNKEWRLYFGSPKFLWDDKKCCPSAPVAPLDENDQEIKRRSLLVGVTLLRDSCTINATRFSTWVILKRVVAWVHRFAVNCKPRGVGKHCLSGDLSCDELRAAALFAVKDMQQDVYHRELKLLREKKGVPKGHALFWLSPFIDSNNVLRVGGRLKNAPIPDASKHQMIIPRDHPITTLIVRHEHRSNGHVGVEHVLANLR